mgnify:CR=1 FL=1
MASAERKSNNNELFYLFIHFSFFWILLLFFFSIFVLDLQQLQKEKHTAVTNKIQIKPNYMI